MNPRGREAEELAAALLSKHGLRIEARNWRCRFGEIDIVARDADCLVFVEVRARSLRGYGGAAESIDSGKRHRLVAAANQYLVRVGLETPCRFDAVLVGATGEPQWVRDAFSAE